MNEFDVCVVGAGLSGLSAARALLRSSPSLRVIVLEARDRAGGRTYTHETMLSDGRRIVTDRGAAYVSKRHVELLKLANEFGVKSYAVPIEGATVFEYDGERRVVDGQWAGSWLEAMDLRRAIAQIDAAASEIDAREPWKSKNAQWLDNQTVDTYLNNFCFTKHARDELRLTWRVLSASELSSTSALQFLHTVKSSSSSLLELTETKDGAQEFKFDGGMQQISNGLRHVVERAGAVVRLNSPVRLIEWNNHSATLHCQRAECGGLAPLHAASFVVKAKRCILAMSPAVVSQIPFTPHLPPSRRQLLNRSFMGSVIKTTTYYNVDAKTGLAPWAKHNVNGRIISQQGPVFDAYPEVVKHGVVGIMGFILASAAHEWRQQTREQRQAAICAQYARLLQCNELLRPILYDEQDWDAEQFSHGCYFSLMAPGTLSSFGPALRYAVGESKCKTVSPHQTQLIRQPCGSLFWAGTETSAFWPGFCAFPVLPFDVSSHMEGAITAGLERANDVLASLQRSARL